MQGYTVEEYQFFVRLCLERISGRAVEELKAIFRQSQSWPAQALEIVILPCGILKGLPVRLFFKNQAHQPIPGGTFALEQALGPVLTAAEEELVYRYDDNGVETLEIELQILIEWFSACWLSADGPKAPLAAFLSIENDLEALDLKEMKWIPNPTRAEKEDN